MGKKDGSSYMNYLVLSATTLIGAGSLIVFFIFIYAGSFGCLDLGLKEPMVLAFDALMCLVFFVSHSTMIRKSCRNRIIKIIPTHYYEASFSITSGM